MTNIRKIYAEINGVLREIQLYVHGEVGYITLECMLKKDYKALEKIAGREVCSDELCELYPIYSDTEDLKERFNDEFERNNGLQFKTNRGEDEMKIRCKKFGDDYTQVQGHEDTIIDFLKDHSFYLRWSYTHEKEKLYNSKFALTHPVTLQTKAFRNTPETYYKLMPKGEILIEEREENPVYTAVLFTIHKEKGKFEDLAWADLLLQAPNFNSLQTISTGHEYIVHTVTDEEQKAYPLFEGGVIIFNEHKHIKAVFNDADGDGFKKTLVKNGYQPI